MKTLDQVEARTPIDATHTPGNGSYDFIISKPGSYYLTGNFAASKANCIHVIAEDVTVDLNGFQISGAASGDGITVESVGGGCTVRNGTIANFGTGLHCIAPNSLPRGGSLSRLIATGCVTAGLVPGENWRVDDCSAHDNIGDGIYAGAGCRITNCAASRCQHFGITGGDGSTVRHCTAYLNGLGIAMGAGSIVEECTATGNYSDGILAGGNCRVIGNTCSNNGLQGGGNYGGIEVIGTGNLIENNTVLAQIRGILVDNGTNNLIIKNTARGNTTNYVIAKDNRYGPIIDATATGAAAVSGNSAPDTTGSTHPWANFSY
jgi:parallel beta-helix repeat protein